MQSDRSSGRIEHILLLGSLNPRQDNILCATFCTLAIEHMSAYMCGITDLTFGVSG